MNVPDNGFKRPAANNCESVKNHGQRLEAMDAPLSAFMEFADQAWLEIWEACGGSNADFLKDVRRAKQKAFQVNSIGAPEEQGRHIGKELVCILVERSFKEKMREREEHDDRLSYVRTLYAMLPYLGGRLKEEIVEELFAEAFKIENEYTRLWDLIKLASYLDYKKLDKVVALVRAEKKAFTRAYHFIRLISKVSPAVQLEIVEETWAAIIALENEDGERQDQGFKEEDESNFLSRVILLVELALFTTGTLKEEAITEAMALGEEADESHLELIVSHLAPFMSEEALNLAFEQVMNRDRDDALVSAISALIPLLPEDRLHEIVARCRSLNKDASKIPLLCNLERRVPEPLKSEMQASLIKIIQAQSDPDSQLNYVCSILRFASLEMKEKLAPLVLDTANATEALELYDVIDFKGGNSFDCILPFLTKEELIDVQKKARTISYGSSRTKRLKEIIQAGWHLLKSNRHKFLMQAFEAELNERREMFSLLEDLAPLVYEIGGDEAIADVVVGMRNVVTWWP